jgi:gluconate kinase
MSIVGQRFAYREHAYTPGDPLHPVEMVKEGPPRSNKVRIRWLEGEYEGLEYQFGLITPL